MSDRVEVAKLPPCDICSRVLRMTAPSEAYADCLLPDESRMPGHGRWANVCRKHFVVYKCRLGTGRGQLLVLKT